MADLNDHNVNWIRIHNTAFVMKFVFSDLGYEIAISDLTVLYLEKLTEASILERFSSLNSFVEMRFQVILRNLKTSLLSCLSQQNKLKMDMGLDCAHISLVFSTGIVSCNYFMELKMTRSDKITEYILAPTIFNVLLCQNKILALKKISPVESKKSSLNQNSEDPVKPEWFSGKNLSIEILMKYFMKIQRIFKEVWLEKYYIGISSSYREMTHLNDYNIDWIQIQNTAYIIKFSFSNTGYKIVVTDLIYLYSETLTKDRVKKRFSTFNPFAQMKLQVILENLKTSLLNCLSQKNKLNMNVCSNKASIILEFSTGIVSYKYNMELEMNEQEITEYVLAPTIFNALLCQNKILELQEISLESNKSSLNQNTEFPVNRNWLVGKNLSLEVFLDCFMNIQSLFKKMWLEHVDTSSRKEKLEHGASVKSMSTNKKSRLSQNQGEESRSTECEGHDEKMSIKEKETTSSDDKSTLKKKKYFKI